MISDSDPVIDELLRWCRAHSIQIDARIHVVRGEDGSIIVLSRDAFIESRTTLVSIPKSAILSTRNCALAELIPQVIYGKQAQLGLALALYGELLNGSSSPWFGYLQSLPDHVSIPLFWDDTKEDEKLALEWIKGTMVEVELLNSSQEVIFKSSKGSKNPLTGLLDDYFESAALPTLSSAGLGDHATIEGFRHAYALVSSRSFVVDTYHGLAMVPVADAFNHSSENQVHLEADYEVCRYCGSLTECPHDTEDEPGGGRPPLLPDRASNATDTSENTCEMVTNAPILPFTEVYNTYGEHLMNSQLLVRYGFVLDVNENDVILWDSAMLTRFVNSIAGCSWKTTEIRSHEEIASQDQRSGRGTDISEKVFEDTTMHQQHSESPILEDGATHSETVMDHNDPVFELSSFILRRVNDVLQLWGHFKPSLTDSSLVYFSDDMGQRPNFNISDSGEEASGMESGCIVPPLSRKRARFHFALEDETRISHHLWIFCTLLALHSHLRLNTHTDAGRRCGTGALEVFHSPMNTKFEKDSQELQYQESCYVELKAALLSTTAIEDITVLKRTFLVQKSLETAHPNLGPEAVNFSDRGIRSPSRAESSAFSAMKSEENKLLPVAREERVEQGVLSSVKTLQQYESHSDSSRKRTRASSIASSTSHQSEGIGIRTRVRRGEQGEVKFSSRTGEEACEDTGIHIFETKFGTLEDPLPVTMRHGQRRNDGLLSDLLRDYGDDSDDSGQSIPNSEVELLSAAGGDASQREIQYQESISQLADVDTRTHPGHGSSETDISKGEKNIPDFRDRHGPNIFASAAEDSRHKADATPNPSSDSVKNTLGGLISENAAEKVDSGDALPDVSLLRLVASTARVVRALCAARTRDMSHPNLGTAELGNVVDAIPASMVQARMAAQVALEERVRLGGCIAAWTEVEETAYRHLHQRA